MRRYKAGMNEIKADEVFKQTIIQQVKASNLEQSSYSFKIRRIAMFFVAASLIILVTMFGVSYYLEGSNGVMTTVQTEAEFHGISITGFKPSEGPTLVKPNVSFGDYGVYMSSSPGFPLQIDCVDADRIHIQAVEGSFVSWSPLTSKVIPKGKEVDIQSGERIYYNPPTTGLNYPEAAPTTKIVIIAYKKDKELGRNTIEISSKDSMNYTGMLLDSE